MSSSNNQSSTFQERRNKLSVWVKRIIQPNREHKSSTSSFNNRNQKTQATLTSQTNDGLPKAPQPSLKRGVTQTSVSTVNVNRAPRKGSPSAAISKPGPPNGNSKQRQQPKQHGQNIQQQFHYAGQMSQSMVNLPRVEFEHPNDNASTMPLVSICSSSMKSTTFSDVHSAQSTRATVFSNKTFDTNSSTVGIPPASIVDRGRHTVAPPSVLSMATSQNTQPPQVRASHRRPNSLHTSVSLTSIATILDS